MPQKQIPLLALMLLFFLLNNSILTAQSREELTNKRQQLIAEIDRASKLLSETKADKKAVLDKYYTLHRQISQREDLISTLLKEVELSNQSLERTTGAIKSLQEDMARLEEEYGAMARQAYRDKVNDNTLVFLFSADGFSDGIKRWRYLQQYEEYRKKQAGLILETRASLSEKLINIEIRRAEQTDLLVKTKRQQHILEKELRTKDNLLKGLKADEKRISSVINTKRKAHQELSKAIERIIFSEIKSRVGNNNINKAPTKKSSSSKKIKPKVTNSFVISSEAFIAQKGKLAWPVKDGVIIRHFGKQNHPIHKQVQITNNGIDIRVNNNSGISAIYSGQVAGVQYVPGYQNTLIIQHGNFYSVYSNLETVTVKKGEVIRGGQNIGLAGISSQTDQLELHLEIWKGKQRLNPAVWLGR